MLIQTDKTEYIRLLEPYYRFFLASKDSFYFFLKEKSWDKDNLRISLHSMQICQLSLNSSLAFGKLPFSFSEMPFDRQRRYMNEYGLPFSSASVFTQGDIEIMHLGGLFDALVQDGLHLKSLDTAPDIAKPIANWIINELMKFLKAIDKLDYSRELEDISWDVFGVITEPLPEVLQEKEAGSLMQLEQSCRNSILENPKAVEQFKAGKDTAINALKGPVMKGLKGKVSPAEVDMMLRKLLD